MSRRLLHGIALGLLLAGAVRTRAEEAPAPVAPETWTLEADRDTRQAVTLAKGQTREQVVALLGRRFARSKSKKDPALEFLRFTRTIVGPLTQSMAKTYQGYTLITHNVYFSDRIEVTLRDGLVVSVTVQREKVRDNPNLTAPFHPPN